jgi:PBP1b-binding outer membrane lipoprotein LpoB
MKRLVISAAIAMSAFIFTSCATDNADNNDARNNHDTKVASNTPQASPYAPPINAPIMDDSGFNRWPLTFRYQYDPNTAAGQ